MIERFTLPDGARLAYERSGRGPAMLLVHGFSLDLDMWRAVAPLLAARRSVVAVDLRGFGRSDLPNGPYTHMADLAGLMDGLAIDRAAVVGLSMGGGIALDFALAYPERASALVAVDATLDGFRWTIDWDLRVRERTLDEIRRAWLASDLLAWPQRDPVVMAWMAQQVSAYSGWHWRNRNPHLRSAAPGLGRLGEIQAPTLALVGEHDHADFRAIAEILARDIPRARLEVLPGVGHLPPMEAPAAVGQAIIRFLDGLR
ncbi:MAG: alpha/beta fold hydrolase [Thermoflexales bacterium]